jgi:hypothetical protein
MTHSIFKMANGDIASVPTRKDTQLEFKRFMKTSLSSIKKGHTTNKNSRTKALYVPGKTLGFQTHMGYSVSTKKTIPRDDDVWMVHLVSPSVKLLVTNQDDLNSLFAQIPINEHSKVKLKWTLKPYLLASIKGNEQVVNAPVIEKILSHFKKKMKELYPECYSAMRTIPRTVRFPFPKSLFTGLTFTVLYASDPKLEVIWHIDNTDKEGTMGMSYRVNEVNENKGGLHVGDTLQSDPGNIQRLPIGQINMAPFVKIPHTVFKPEYGTSYAFNGYQNEAVLESAHMVERGAKLFKPAEKYAFKAQFAKHFSSSNNIATGTVPLALPAAVSTLPALSAATLTPAAPMIYQARKRKTRRFDSLAGLG